MIKQLVAKFEAEKHVLRDQLAEKHPDDYKELVRSVVVLLSAGDYGDLDPERIHEINDGDYQGTLLYVIAASSYQPSDYWYVKVGYGSCSGCDTLQAISNYSSEKPTEDQINDYMTLALHIVQGLKKMGDEED